MTLTKHSTFDALQLLFKGTPDLNSARSHDSKAVLSMFAARILDERRYAGEGDHTGRQASFSAENNASVAAAAYAYRILAKEFFTTTQSKKSLPLLSAEAFEAID